MKFIDDFMIKWEAFSVKMRPMVEKTGSFFSKVGGKIVYAWNYVMMFKKIFLTVPVAVLAVILAIRNLFSLPPMVGLILGTDGEFTLEVIREVAVLGPLAVTAICLLLVFLSKRTLTPWMVSLFSALLPIWILFLNTFPS